MKHSSQRNIGAIRGIALRIMAVAIPVIGISSLAAQSTTKGQCTPPEGIFGIWTLVDASKSNHLCVNPKIDWRTYDGVQIEPATFVPGASTKPLKPEEVQKLTAYLDIRLKDAYKNHPTGATSLSIKPTITDTKRSKPPVNVVGMLAVHMVLSYGGASILYDIADAKTGETIAVLTDTRKGRFYDIPEGLSSLGHSRVVLKRSAKQLRKNTDRLRTQLNTLNPSSNMVLNAPPAIPGR